MLGRKSYTQDELDDATARMDAQLAAYRKLAGAVASDPAAQAALDEFAPLFFNNLTLVLDRLFVHRLRSVTGKDANPLNEVELLADSLMNNGGEFRGNSVVKLVPEETVLGTEPGEQIAIGEDGFERLAQAFLDDIRTKYVAGVAA